MTGGTIKEISSSERLDKTGVFLHSMEESVVIIKNNLSETLLQFAELLQRSSLYDISQSSLEFHMNEKSSGKAKQKMIAATDCEIGASRITRQLEYVRNFLRVINLLPVEIVGEACCKLLRDCDLLIKSAVGEAGRISETGEKDVEEESSLHVTANLTRLLILPVVQVTHDCIELNSSVIAIKNQVGPVEVEPCGGVKYAVRIFAECTLFLLSCDGMKLTKSDFNRLLALCQKTWVFINNSRQLKKAGNKDEDEVQENLEQLIKRTEGVLNDSRKMASIIFSENGRSFIKFWCEMWASKEGYPKSLHCIPSGTIFPEFYMVFTEYLKSTEFWQTEAGKMITPTLIRAIRRDLGSEKPETRKRATFVLQAITSSYAMNKPIFNPSVPEVSVVSLNNMERGNYTKFWKFFYDLYDVLNETQLHIVQPVLHKLSIFQELSDNEVIFTWLPILLIKMIQHDNRTVVKEGLEQFLRTGKYLKSQSSNVYRTLAGEFLDNHVMPLLQDHVGWVLNEPEEFFKNIVTFAQFLTQLYVSSHSLPHFKSAEKVLVFLTSSGKCMGCHIIFFLISSVDEVMNFNFDHTTDPIVVDEIISSIENCMTLFAHLLSNSITTISKYFRELLEERCVSILLKISMYIRYFPGIHLNSTIFNKLLTILGSLSKKVFTYEETSESTQAVVKVFCEKAPNLLPELLTGSSLYDFTLTNLSETSVFGLFRFLRILSRIYQQAANMIRAVDTFVEHSVTKDLVQGSIRGLREYHFMQDHQEEVHKVYAKIGNLLSFQLNSDGKLSWEDFMYCVRCIEVLNCFPTALSNMNYSALGKIGGSDALKMHLLRKLYVMHKNKLASVKALHDLEKADGDGLDRLLENADNITEEYFVCTGRNILAEFHELKFRVLKDVVDDQAEMSDALRLKTLNIVLDTIEKCRPKGVATALLLAKAVIKSSRSDDNPEITNVLQNIISIGWRLAFELRKSEAFWHGIQAFVEFLCDPYFVKTGDLEQYADLMFEHGETICGLQITFVKQLVGVEFPDEMLQVVHRILLKAALSGAALPKNNRVSFAIWNYLLDNDKNNKLDNDPENFSSNCKARILACEKLRVNIHHLVCSGKPNDSDSLLNAIVNELLQRNEIESINRKRYFSGSMTHRVKQRIFQLLLVLQPYFTYEVSKIILDRVLYSLSFDSPQPSVRYMGEWLVALTVQRYPQLFCNIFDCLNNVRERKTCNLNVNCIQTRIGFGAFFATICNHISKYLKSPEFYDMTLQSLASLTLSQHVTVRIYSQVAFQKIFDRARENKFDSIVEKYSPALTALTGALIHISGNCSKLLDNISQDFYVNHFDSKAHYCPEVIFSLLPRLSGMMKDECVLHPNSISKLLLHPAPLNHNSDSKDNIMCLDKLKQIYLEHEKSVWHLRAVVVDGRELGDEFPNDNVILHAKNATERVQMDELNYQKKINPWKLLTASEEIYEYSNNSTKKRSVSEEGLVVVASLLDHFPNLGGLCRTCEIFGANKYVVSSLKVINDQQFQSLSVSAQNWVNILEVPVRDLETFLLTYSAKGYAILGVEQASESSLLTDFKFPKKSVLLLGNEKQGIPCELLRLVDKCIEIPQTGIIRSLNVHVTGALCIWHYASQHTFIGN